MKKSVIIGIGIAAGVLVTGAIVAGVIIANRPAALLARAITNDINDFRRSEQYKYLDDVANGGSITVSADLSDVADEDMFLELSGYPNIIRGTGASRFTVYEDSDREDVVASALLAYDPDKITLSSEELIGEDVYGVDLKNLEENIDGTFLDPDEGGKYARLGQALLNLSTGLDTNKGIENDSYSIAEDYRKMIIDALIENSVVTKSSDSITVAGENISCKVVTITTDIEGLADSLKQIIDYASDDEELEEYLTQALFNTYSDPEEAVDEFYDMLDELEDDLNDLDTCDGELVIDCYITKSGTRLAQVDLSITVEDDLAGENTVNASLVLGRRIDKIKEISFSFENSDETDFEIVYTVSEDSRSAFKAEIEVEETSVPLRYYYDDEYSYEDPAPITSTFTVELDWDKKSGDYKIIYEDESEDYTLEIEFNYIEDGNTHTLSLADFDLKITGEDTGYIDSGIESVRDMDITVVLERNAKAPKAPKSFIEITELDEDDVEDILDDATDELEDIF